ncbi:MAG: ABC transporter transmembrane domain-containing protein, partial [Candidatus Dormiibacterota bacterium]
MTPLPTWRYVARLIRYARWLYPLHGLLWGTNNLLVLVPGLLAGLFFDTLTGHEQVPLGWTGLLLVMALVAAGQAALWLLGGYVEILLRFRISGLLRHNLLRRLLDRPGARALSFSIGETISRFRDDAHQAEDHVDWTDEMLGQSLVAAVALGVLVHVNALLTLVVFLPLVVVTAVARRAGGALGRYRAASSQATSQVTGAIGDLLAASPTLQAAGAEERAVAHFRRLNRRRRRAMLADRVATQALESITSNAVSVGTGVLMLLAAGTLRSGSLTVGGFVLFAAYLGFVADFTADLGRFLADHRLTGVAFARMHGVLGDTPPAALVEPAA